jgi:hypothetical protein
VNALARVIVFLAFVVSRGDIDAGACDVVGFINGTTALWLLGASAGGATFLDLLNAKDRGASGVRDGAPRP